MSHKGKVVIVTGAGSGIGAATAKLFAKEESDVIIVDKNEESAKKTAEICKEFGSRVLAITADISKDDEAQRIITTTIEHFGKLNVLINNAGIIRAGSLLSGNIMKSYDETMNVNLRSVILMASLATPYLVQSKGCVVNTSSVCSVAAKFAPSAAVYSASKAGVDSFTKVAALELAPSGVRINAVNPGPVFTKIYTHANMPHSWDDFNAMTALGKSADPEEIANLIFYLASDKAKSITGACYLIDNGMALM